MPSQQGTARIESGEKYLASIGGKLVEVVADCTRDGIVWLCRDRIGQFFPVKTHDLHPRPDKDKGNDADC